MDGWICDWIVSAAMAYTQCAGVVDLSSPKEVVVEFKWQIDNVLGKLREGKWLGNM